VTLDTTDLDRLLATAQRAAIAAAGVLRDRLGKVHTVAYKGRVNLVTEADTAAEAAILAEIRADFPGADILAEESGGPEAAAGGDLLWVVDPLDGTTNFAHGYPFFCTSIAVMARGEPIVGLIHDPVRGETFAAAAGRGATLDGRPMRVSAATDLDASLLCTGFVYDRDSDLDLPLARFERAQRVSRGVRRDGSAALDLAFVAAGRLDGFFELRLKAWDVAAGLLLVREAGGRVTRADGTHAGVFDGDVVATNGRIHEAVLGLFGDQS
jgi:myo-inositol-1(or 4)-monophosphatase